MISSRVENYGNMIHTGQVSNELDQSTLIPEIKRYCTEMVFFRRSKICKIEIFCTNENNPSRIRFQRPTASARTGPSFFSDFCRMKNIMGVRSCTF